MWRWTKPHLICGCCQESSPYAAHLYEAEDPYTPVRGLPGLCFGFCSALYHKCCHVVKYLMRDAREGGETTFCSLLELSDRDYCYPNVLQTSDLNNKLGQVAEDPRQQPQQPRARASHGDATHVHRRAAGRRLGLPAGRRPPGHAVSGHELVGDDHPVAGGREGLPGHGLPPRVQGQWALLLLSPGHQ